MHCTLEPTRLFALFFLFMVSLGATLTAIMHERTYESPKIFPQISSYTIGYSGIGPTTISLNWTKSTGGSFNEYVLQNSTDGSSWATFANILDITNTSIYISGLVSGSTNWWQVIIYDPLSHSTNALKITQPSPATLSYTQQTATSVELKWNNNAAYGGLISFDSYQPMESVNSGVFFPVARIVDESSLGYTVNGLVPSTDYSFYLNTTDRCNGCSGLSLATTESNKVQLGTPGPLMVAASASPVSVDVGQLVYFSCSSRGGASPYSYSWTFGDGGTSLGSNPTHVYGSSGEISAVCIVTDGLGTSKASDPVPIVAYTDPLITSFTATPTNLYVGHGVSFFVSTSGGNGSLTFSYVNLPPGCSSSNYSFFSCIPTSSGTYDVTVSVTDQGQETANSTLRMSIAPPHVLGLPRNTGLAVIFGGILGTSVVVILSAVLLHRRKGNMR